MSPGLEFDRVSRWYGPVLGISDISFRVESGVVGLLGKNGAGKTTLLKLAAGLLDASIGAVRVFGGSPQRLAVRARIGICSDVDRFYERMTGRDWVTWQLRLAGVANARVRATEALERLDMQDRMDTRIGGYSKGMRQRVKFARAIAGDADLLLLDEPLNGLDPVGRHDVVKLIQELGESGKSVLVSSHVLQEVEEITRSLLLIHQGRVLAEGTIENIRTQLEERAHLVELRARDLRGLAARIIGCEGVEGLDVVDGRLVARVRDTDAFFDEVTSIGSDFGVSAVVPLDAGLEAVFDYLVKE
ncbi:MAG: ABC transporter [Planctomycetes bacterium]|nr:ABC transporter [Planctomycetota bacterium]